MKIKRVKALSVVLAAVLLCGVLTSCRGFADDTEYAEVSSGNVSADGLIYTLYENGSAVVTGRESTAAHLIIPEEIDGHRTTAVADSAFYGDLNVCTVTVASSVRKIGKSAFDSCSSMLYCDLGGGVETVGAFAFSDCLCLVDVQGLDRVISIGDSAFSNCESLCTVRLPKTLTELGASAFYACACLTEITLPEGLKTLGKGCFSYCKSLVSVEFGGLTAIPEEAFLSCRSLGAVTLGSAVTSIGVCAFRNCLSLRTVNVGKGVTEVGSSAFEGCDALYTVNYAGKRAAWDKIRVADGNDLLTRAHVYFGK